MKRNKPNKKKVPKARIPISPEFFGGRVHKSKRDYNRKINKKINLDDV